MQHTFLYISLQLFRTNSTGNFQKRLLWRKFRTCSCSRFFTAAHFLLALVADSISHFVTAVTKFSCCFSNKKMSPSFFISSPRSLSSFFWPAAYFLFFSVSDTRIQKQFPLSVFVFIDSLAAFALQDAGGYAISRHNNLESHLGCNTCWLNYFTLVYLWCRMTDGRSGTRSRD